MTSLTCSNLVATEKFGHLKIPKPREIKCPFNNMIRSSIKLHESSRLRMIDT